MFFPLKYVRKWLFCFVPRIMNCATLLLLSIDDRLCTLKNFSLPLHYRPLDLSLQAWIAMIADKLGATLSKS